MTLKLDNDPTTTKVQTRDGREAVILDYCPGQGFCLIGKFKLGGDWAPMSWTAGGNSTHNSYTMPSDLVNAPRTWWVNVYADGSALSYDRKTDADKQDEYDFLIGSRRIACVKVTEGEGLDEPEPGKQDYVLDMRGDCVRVGDLVTAAGVHDVLLVTAVDSKINWLSATKAIRDNPCVSAIGVKGRGVILIKSNSTGGTDV